MLSRGTIALLSLSLATSGCLVSPRRGTEPMLPGPDRSGSRAAAEGTGEPGSSLAGIVTPPWRGQLYNDLVHVTGEIPGAAFDVDVAPEADAIVFACDGWSTLPKLFTQPIAGGSPVQRTFGAGSDIQPKWSPDGKWIAFASDRDGNFDIFAMRADGTGGAWQITSDPTDELHPSWSPDGADLAYCAKDAEGIWYLWRVKLEGSVHTQLVPGLFPEWSPDGARIAFQSPSARGPGFDEIWLVGVDGDGLMPVVSDPRFGAVQPTWDPTGERIVFASITSPIARPWETPRATDIWMVGLDGSPPARLTDDAAEDYAPCFGIDGRVYFTSDRRGGHRILSLKPAGPDSPFASDEPLPPGGGGR
jgi:TolB protein